nr:PREDICTED: uncharacterized protein LOC103979153 isoform X1 [Musa acuminata subsp. malaccensis]
MATAAAAGDDDDSSSPSSMSPRNRLKFLCSYGGKILPRPYDGLLKYVGGDTRVLGVPRSISFSGLHSPPPHALMPSFVDVNVVHAWVAELKERIQGMFRRCELIKYQLVSEDLDTLVTVTCDQELVHMLEEYDRLDALHPCSPSFASSPRFRLFLFASPSATSASGCHRPAATLDQRYVDAINTAAPTSPRRPMFTVSSASSAFTSPTSTIDGPAALLALRPNAPLGGSMQRVQSTPNLSGGGMHRVSSTPNLGQNSGTGPQHHHNHHHHHPHHLHRQYTSAAAAYGAQAAGMGGVWRNSGARRHEAGGFGSISWVPPAAPRGGVPYGGGSVCFGHADEAPSGRQSRSGSPFRAPPREPIIWE